MRRIAFDIAGVETEPPKPEPYPGWPFSETVRVYGVSLYGTEQAPAMVEMRRVSADMMNVLSRFCVNQHSVASVVFPQGGDIVVPIGHAIRISGVANWTMYLRDERGQAYSLSSDNVTTPVPLDAPREQAGIRIRVAARRAIAIGGFANVEALYD